MKNKKKAKHPQVFDLFQLETIKQGLLLHISTWMTDRGRKMKLDEVEYSPKFC